MLHSSGLVLLVCCQLYNGVKVEVILCYTLSTYSVPVVCVVVCTPPSTKGGDGLSLPSSWRSWRSTSTTNLLALHLMNGVIMAFILCYILVESSMYYIKGGEE